MNKWLQSYYNAKSRCECKLDRKYHRYGGRGIKLLMTKMDFERIWHRDMACLMKAPTIDRIDNNGNYEISNCRFIERTDNARKENIRITKSDIIKIKELYAKGNTTYREMEKIFCIKRSQLCNIVNGRTR